MGTAAAGDALVGLRVLDCTDDRAGGVCTMVLADLGADVVRVEGAGGVHARPAPDEAAGPVCWDRGKRRTVVGALDLADSAFARLVTAADVVVVDDAPGLPGAAGRTADALAAHNPRAVVGRLPANGTHGGPAGLPADPLLLAAVSGYAQWQPGIGDVPVAPVVAYPSNVQGTLGASAVLAALLERDASGAGQTVTVSGLHATSLLLATVACTSLDQPMAYTSTRDTRGAPSFRIYRCGDGAWLFLGALVPTIFLTALDALDLLDVMVMPGIDGEFLRLFVGDNGVRAGERLEARFAEQPRQHWLDVLAAAGVPAAAVRSRTEWLADDAFIATGGRVVHRGPGLGEVLQPALPVAIGGTGPLAGPPCGPPVDAATVWTAERAAMPPPPAPGRAPRGAPLAGLRVVDCSTFLAGPTAPTLLAQWGADVVKVEPPSGDPYRIYNVAYAGANQGKRRVVLDLTTPDGMRALHALVADADVLVDNFRPALRAKFGLHSDALLRHNPRLVHVTVSGFGDDGPLADSPAFDPVIQACSGLMHACGDDEQPYYTSTPVHDVATGSLALVGALAALLVRARTGRGGRVSTSLAASSRLVQLEELVDYDDRPPTRRGGPAFTGASIDHAFHRAADGWVAVAAPGRRAELLAWGEGDEGAFASAVSARPVAQVVAELAALGVPAARVVPRDELATDPHLAAHRLVHAVHDDEIGGCLVVNQVAEWGRSEPVDTVAGPRREPDPPVWIAPTAGEAR